MSMNPGAKMLADESIVRRWQRRAAQMRPEREPLESIWRDIEDNLAPNTAKALRQQNSSSTRQTDNLRASHRKIINPTPLYSMNTMAAGMHSSNTSPARPWFRLTTPDPALAEDGEVKLWLYTVEMRIREVFARSNLYRVLPNVYRDAAAYATAAMLAFDDDEDILTFQHLQIGSYWIAQNKKGRVDTLYREFQHTVRQLVDEFGFDACSLRVQNMYNNGQFEQWVDVCHAIEPSRKVNGGKKLWMSLYWEKSCDGSKALAERYFRRNPIIAPRWDTSGDSVYGTRCPGMDVLGECMALQFKEVTLADALQKSVKPPLTGPTSLRNQRVSLVAGDVTYVDQTQAGGGLRSVFDVRFDLNAARADVQSSVDLIRQGLYTDLFLMMQNDLRSNVTAREIQEKHEEKLLMLGPVVERLNDEQNDPLIDIAFDALVEQSEPFWRGVLEGEPLLPPPPEILGDVDLKVEFISVLSQAQKSVSVSGQNDIVQFVGQLAGLKQDLSIWDKLDIDQLIDERADMVGISPRAVRSDEAVAEMREQQAQQKQQAQAMQMAQMGAQAARDMGSVKKDSVMGEAMSSGGMAEAMQGMGG